MKATKTVPQSLLVRKPANPQTSREPAIIHFPRLFAPSHGAVVLVGYGIKVRVDRGHLILEDGIGNDRRAGRFPRVHHGLRRIVVIGADGMVSLAALQWLADQKIAFVMLDRDGSVLLTTGPVAASDARLRRAQACAVHSPAAVDIVRELIRLKIAGQETVARKNLNNRSAAETIEGIRQRLEHADSIDTVRMLEGHAAAVYWTAWQAVAIQFPQSDFPRLPDHWRTFGARRSPISGTSRRPPTPVNAILNYLYTLLESETRFAIAALGLDPGFGLLHVDQATRDSLVYDLMEPVRPKIDSYVLDWLIRTPLKRSWFFEERDGCCRLMSELTVTLSDTTATWSREVAPIVEWFAQILSSTVLESGKVRAPGTRLTQRRRYEGTGASVPAGKEARKQPSLCILCGAVVTSGNRFCHACGRNESGKRMAAVQRLGKDAARSPKAMAKKVKKMNQHRDALRNWNPSEVPDWLTDDLFMTQIYPALARLSKGEIASVLGISKHYAYQLANGNRVPHKRHWLKLADLVGVTPPANTW